MPKLLLAVESDTIRRVLELTFAASAIDVVTAGDGEQAIARIPAERPDGVIADITLPKRGGYEVAAFVKDDPALSHIRVLLLAGAFDEVDERRAAAVRCDGILAKPFEPPQVLSRVNALLGLEPAGSADPDSVPGGELRRPDVASAFDRPAGPLSRPDGHGHPAVPTVDGLIGGGDRQPGDVRETFDLATAGDPPSGLRSRPAPPPLPPPTIADAFAALLADEEGHRPAAPVRLPTQPVPPAVGEDVIEEIVRRVVGRLALGAVKDVVADVVSEIAERLVREEIARIRGEVVARHDDTPRLRGTEDPR